VTAVGWCIIPEVCQKEINFIKLVLPKDPARSARAFQHFHKCAERNGFPLSFFESNGPSHYDFPPPPRNIFAKYKEEIRKREPGKPKKWTDPERPDIY